MQPEGIDEYKIIDEISLLINKGLQSLSKKPFSELYTASLLRVRDTPPPKGGGFLRKDRKNVRI
jgi:hypothetical protein